MNNKGFTILEALIALSIVAISFLGIYNLLNLSIDITNYSKNKLFLYKKGYETFLKNMNFDISISEESYADDKIYYVKEGAPTIIPGITEITLTIKFKNLKDYYIYYAED